MDKTPTVLVTNPLHADGVAMLAEAGIRMLVAPDTSPETLNRLAYEVDGIIVRAQLPPDICEHAPGLKGIVRHGVGLDFIPLDSATAHGIPVANLPGCNTQAVAELVIAQLLNLRRPLVRVDARLRAEGWETARAMAGSFSELGGSTLGIVGVGTIGKRIAAIASAFGMTIIGASRSRGAMPDGVAEVRVDELFAQADAVVLSCALTDQTRGLVNAARIAAMKPHAVLINVSRGAVVDSAALVDALRKGAIAGAALDVFDAQPLPATSPLLDCPNLLLTPHIAAITTTSSRTMSVGAVGEMLRILAGEDPLNLVNPDYKRQRV